MAFSLELSSVEDEPESQRCRIVGSVTPQDEGTDGRKTGPRTAGLGTGTIGQPRATRPKASRGGSSCHRCGGIRFWAAAKNDGVRPVLLVDEAHEMRPDVLAMLRILTNFEMDSRLVVSVVLAGQKPLGTLLDSEALEAVAHRLAHVATLRLLSREETSRYVEHRCAIAGAATVPFGAEALEMIFELSRGNLRAIDCLALKSLQLAAAQDRATVGGAEVAAARKHLYI